MNGDIKENIVLILNAAFGIKSHNVEINEGDMPNLVSIFNRQNILPILSFGLKNMGYSNWLTDDLKKSEAKSVFDYTQRKTSLDEIAKVFESEAISFIPLKGLTICDLYPEPWMRTSNDIDILVHKEDLNKARELLEENTSFSFLKYDQHDVSFINKYVHLELHFSLLCGIEKLDIALFNPWIYSTNTANSHRYYFSNEFNLFYTVAHAAKHFLRNGGIGIRPILDIYVLKTHTEFNEELVTSLCDKAGVLGFYNTCCKLIDVWFKDDSHNELSQSFEDIVISGGVFGSKHLKMVSNKRRDSGKKYISGRIFKTSEELKNYYPKCRNYPILVPYYQVVRWTKVFDINKTKDYVSEFKQADSIDQSEVEKYDKLLKAMGL